MDFFILDEWFGITLSDKHINLIFLIFEKSIEVHSKISVININHKWYAYFVESNQYESILNHIFFGLYKIHYGDINMRDYYSAFKLII